jgi:nucleoside-triphosphatase
MGGVPSAGRADSPSIAPDLGNSVSAAPSAARILFISGSRGVGKTKLVKEATFSRRERIGGFYTEHMMSGRIHKGFMIHTFDGQERMLAAKGLKSPYQLGNYGVDLNALENVGVPALKLALMSKELIVIDEVGSMEMMSERFRLTLLESLASDKPILATIRSTSQPFSDQVKKLANSQLLQLTKSNYASIKQQVRKWLDAHL